LGINDDLQRLRSLRQQVETQLAGGQTFGQRIKEMRLERDMTLDDLAQATGISKAYLSQVENGHVDPPRDEKIRKLEEVFGQRPQSLVEQAHLARVPEDVRRRLSQLQSAFARAQETVETLLSHVPGAAGGRRAGANIAAAANDNGEQQLQLQQQHPPAVLGASTATMANDTGGALSTVRQAHGKAGSGQASPAPTTANDHDGGTTTPQAIRGTVPIINRVAAGYPEEFTDLDYPAGVADEYMGTPPGLDDPNAFGVHVVGDSMEPRYHQGDIVLFSPRATVRSGDDCYVRFSPEARSGQGATFKRVYFDSASTARLQPLNDRYPPTVVPLEEIAGLYKAAYRYECL
jgi:phage repressor protein C with HTH and peptisase S24 domain/DNA-binding XRE family transcriptional regulator